MHSIHLNAFIHPRLLATTAVIGAACVLACTACTTENHPDSHSRKMQFSDVSAAVGLTYQGMSFGAACGDADGDGDCDIFVPRHWNGHGAALLQNKDSSFVDISDECFVLVSDLQGDRHGASFWDLDDDGDQDLTVATGAHYGEGAEAKKIFENRGGQYIDIAGEIRLDIPLFRGRGFLFADVNRDSLLDAVIAARRRPFPRIGHSVFLQHRDGSHVQFERTNQFTFGDNIDGEFIQLTSLPQFGQAFFVHGWPCHLYAVRDAHLEDITHTVGLHNLNTVGDAAWADFDGDGDLDLFCGGWLHQSDITINDKGLVEAELICLDSSHEVQLTPVRRDDDLSLQFWGIDPSEVFVGSGAQTVRDSKLELKPLSAEGLSSRMPKKSLAIGFDSDRGCWRLRFLSDVWARVAFTASFQHGVVTHNTIGFDKSDNLKRTKLYLWEDNHFTDRSDSANLPLAACSSVAAADFDCDGDVDVYLVNSTGVRNLSNLFLENDGSACFTVHANGAGATGSSNGSGDTVTVLDYDGDGGLDLFLTNGQGEVPFSEDGPEQLYHNTGPRGHWLFVNLVGKHNNRDAIGAQVRVRAGNLNSVRLQDGGVHCRAQNQRTLHFGLGNATTVDEIEVLWPNGSLQVVDGGPVDRVITIHEH